jgi:hypothetical protein
MSTKNSRSGGKYSGNHTSVIPAAGIISDLAHDLPTVTKISPGFIKTGLKSSQGRQRIKITTRPGNLLLTVRGNISQQEITIYTTDVEETKRALAGLAKSANFQVVFASINS